MHKNRDIAKKKGDMGEEAVRQLLLEYSKIRGGFIFLSYMYPYQSNSKNQNYPGNLHWDSETNTFKDFNGQGKSYKDEVDIVYITPNRIFLIEVKARGGTWKLYDHWSTQNSRIQDKCPVMQSEKHARHFYHLISEVIPDGDPDYIIPILVFVDESKIKDMRQKEQQQYIHVCILNTFMETIQKLDKPKDYLIDIVKLKKYLNKQGEHKSYANS